jgi:tetratricopeptide (TPR) repeat protein
MLAEQGHEDEAIQGYERLLQTHPELPDLHYSLGMLYRKRRMWDRALEVFRAQVAHDPQDERAAARVSEALVELSQWNDVRDFLEPRVKGSNPPLWAVLDLSEALQNLDDPQRAIELLATAEKENMSNKSIHYRLLLLYRKVGNVAQVQAEDQWLRSPPK